MDLEKRDKSVSRCLWKHHKTCISMQNKLHQLVRHSAGNQFSQVKNVCNIYYKLADFIRDLIMQYLVTFMSVY